MNDRDMKLGIVPLWSAYMELSNDVFKMNSHFCQKLHLTKGYNNPWFFHDFESKFNLQQNRHQWNAPFMLITMVQIPASYLIRSPTF